MTTERQWAAAFADAFAGTGTPVEQRVYAQILGEAHPAELDTYSLLTRDELDRIAAWLELDAGGLVVDLGCGRGGPGIWLAARRDARLLGLDVTDAPFDAARRRADRAGVDATFRIGSLTRTGLGDAAADAVLSIDALQFADDPSAALAEVARVLRPGGRLALTAAEHVDDLDTAVRRAPLTADRARRAGLEVTACDSPRHWTATARRITTTMLEAADDIAAETGADPAEVRDALVRLASDRRQERRVLLLASRPR